MGRGKRKDHEHEDSNDHDHKHGIKHDKKGEKYQRFSVSLPETLLNEFDEVANHFNISRSDAIRKAMRDYIGTFVEKHNPNDEIAGSITTVMMHHEKHGLMDELTHLEHHNNEIIIATLHVHLDHDNCLQIYAVNGKRKEVDALFEEFLKRPQLKQTKKSIMTSEKTNKS